MGITKYSFNEIKIHYFSSDVPSKPGRPQIGNLLSRKVFVWWLASTEDHNSVISSYLIQVRLVKQVL